MTQARAIGRPVPIECQRRQPQRLVDGDMIGVGAIVFAQAQLAQSSLGTAGGECRRGPDEMAFRCRWKRVLHGHLAGFDAVLFQEEKGDQKPS